MIKGFFAYPNDTRISETVGEFCHKINQGGLVEIKTWEQMRIGGKILISEICKQISESQLFCADITRLNPNVLFEIGYAIAKKKRIWLVRDNSIPTENFDFKQFRILTTLGYREYINSIELTHHYYKDLPHESLEETVYDEVIAPSLRIVADPHLLYLKAFYEDETSIKVTQRVGSDCTKKKVPFLVDDPRESSVQPLGWYARNVYAAGGVVCHLTAVERENSRIQNAKHSLVAGLAYGFDVPLLMLIEKNLFGPTDYRDLLYSYNRTTEALNRVATFLEPLIRARNGSSNARAVVATRERSADQLAALDIGEPIAEHEGDDVTDEAFINTSAYQAGLSGAHTIFVGRKGVGKTANFRKISRELSRDKRILVCEIKPLSYELESLVSVAKKFEMMSRKGFLFESLWKFLIYSEIAIHVIQSIEGRASQQLFENEMPLVALFEKRKDLLSLDFSARLDKLSNDLLNASLSDSHSPESTLAVSEILHSGILKELLEYLSLALEKKIKVLVLVDNLDKAWDRGEDTRFLCYFFLGLLSASRRVAHDFRGHSMHGRTLEVGMCIFVRADIFEVVLQQAREPDKIHFQRITWDDTARLRLLAEQRLVSAVGALANELTPELLWSRFFPKTIATVPAFDYIFSIVLRRPRDLLFFLRAAISTAVNRRHARVEEDDFIKAEEAYADFVYQSLLVELRETIPLIEDILLEFMGSQPHLNENKLRQMVMSENGQRAVDFELIVRLLCLRSFLEIDVPGKGFSIAHDEKEYAKLSRAASNVAKQVGLPINYRISRAFWRELLIDDSQVATVAV